MSAQISILMNCYNGEKYLRQAIESVIAQDYTDWELIFWDNQSTDQSAAIAKSYNDDRIKYYYAPTHEPLHRARIAAFEKAQCPWIGFLDTDDYWLPGKLTAQMQIVNDAGARREEVVLVYGRSRQRQELEACEIDVEPLPGGRIYSSLLKWNFISLPTVIVRREGILGAGGIHPFIRLAGDYYLWLKIARKYPVHCSNEVLAVYRIHGQNLTGLQPGRIDLEVLLFKLFYFYTIDWLILGARCREWCPLKNLLRPVRNLLRRSRA